MRVFPSSRFSLLSSAVLMLGLATACPKDTAETAAASDAGDALSQVGQALPGVDNPHTGGHGQAPSRSAIQKLPDDAKILVVNSVVYTKRQLVQAITQSALAAGIPPNAIDAPSMDAFEKPAYEKLIERQLLTDEAKRRGLFPSAADAEKATQADRDRLVATLPPGKTFADALKELGTDEATFKTELQADVAVQRLLAAVEAEVQAPSEAALKKAYDDNLSAMTVPDMASASHILIKAERNADGKDVAAAEAKIKAIHASLKGTDKATFQKTAAEKSEDSAAPRTRGDLGTFTKGDLLPELEAAAFVLAEGSISAPVRSDRGFHILFGQGVKKGATRTFDEVKPLLAQRERTRALMTSVDTLIGKLRADAKIERVVEPLPSPFDDKNANGSQVPSWRPGTHNAAPSVKNPHGATATTP